MDLRVLQTGWRRHLAHFRRLRRRFEGGQDPKVFCLSCSDARVSVHEIFDLNEPGSIFEVKNVGGLFSDDAKAALIYALNHLRPEYIVLLHHTRCGGYASLGADAEPEVRMHLVRYLAFASKRRVEEHLAAKRAALPEKAVEQLVLEEGCRIQADSLRNYLSLYYPKLHREVKEGRVKVLPLLYHTVTGKVCVVPDRLEGSEDMRRREL
jgi:carbonic anhydrase